MLILGETPMALLTPFRTVRLPRNGAVVLVCLVLALAGGWASAAEGEPAALAEPDQHSQYHLDITVGGQTVGWTVKSSPALTIIEPPGPDQQTRLTGYEPVYTGAQLGDESHRIDRRLDALVPVFREPVAELPLSYTDARDRKHRLRDIQVHLYPTDQTRRIDGHRAHGYALAVLSDLSSRRNDEWHDSTALRYGTVWVWPDRPFSPVPLQINRHALVAFASELPSGSATLLQDRLIAALESTGMIAAVETASYRLAPDRRSEFDDSSTDPMRENDQLAQRLGVAVEMVVRDFHTHSQPVVDAEIGRMPRLDAADSVFLDTALTTVSRMGLCRRLDAEDLLGLTQLLADSPPFQGDASGPFEGAARGQAAFGFEDDDFFGQGFLVAIEAFNHDFDAVICMALLRINDGKPAAPTALAVAADDSLDPDENRPADGDMVAHVIVADVDVDGMVNLRSAGMAEEGQINLTWVDEEQVRGTLRISGRLLTRDGQRTEIFSLEGDFDAELVWDRVPVRR